MPNRKAFLAASALVLAFAQPALAGTQGFQTAMQSGQNMVGAIVPEIVVTVDRGRKILDRARVQQALRNRLSQAGVRPQLIELQSVATAAMTFAAEQDMGNERICYETWCAQVYLGG